MMQFKLINKFLLISFLFTFYSCGDKNNLPKDIKILPKDIKILPEDIKILEYKILQSGKENYPTFIFLAGQGGNMDDFNKFKNSNLLNIIENFPVYGINGSINKDKDSFDWFNFNYLEFSINALTLMSLATRGELDNLNQTLFDLKILDETYNTCAKQLKKTIEQIKSDSKTNEVYILGFSQGAIAAYELVCRYPSLLNGMVSLMGIPINFPKENLDKYKHLNFFAINGNNDKVISPVIANPLTDFFKSKLPGDSKFIHEIYNIGHLGITELDEETIENFTNWINNLKPSKD